MFSLPVRFLRKLVPEPVLRAYHLALAFLADMYYGEPSRAMYVIGVTGTKGKTTTAYLISEILNGAGMRCGLTSSVYFGFGGVPERNMTKQGMPGRFALQKLLWRMKNVGCTHAVVETTSEGMLQYRHRFIDYRMAVFTNLSPEHIERHGGFERYRETKVGLFRKVAWRKDGVGVYNFDDPNVGEILKPDVPRKTGFQILDSRFKNDSRFSSINFQSIINVQNVRLGANGAEFDIEGVHFEAPLVGEFNVYNAVGAIAAARTLGVSLEKCAEILRNVRPVAGRFEIVQKEPFAVVVDYAHEPRSLEEAYKAAKLLCGNQESRIKNQGTDDGTSKLICVFGATGGGRDRWKRPEMGKVAAWYCDEIILTNDDPYDEKPIGIIREIRSGTDAESRIKNKESRVFEIVDRRGAIRKAISLAGPGDVVILTGKGGETVMCLEGGKKIPWDERGVVEEELRIKNQESGKMERFEV